MDLYGNEDWLYKTLTYHRYIKIGEGRGKDTE